MRRLKPKKNAMEVRKIVTPGQVAPGDIVRLVTGGPLMVVLDILNSSPMNPSLEVGKCDNLRCVWFVRAGNDQWAGPFADTFAVGIIELVEQRGGVAPQPVIMTPQPEIVTTPKPVAPSTVDVAPVEMLPDVKADE